jgi:hypothetical protein
MSYVPSLNGRSGGRAGGIIVMEEEREEIRKENKK